jgi:dsDNA-binding SOS-regulon protein
VQSIPPYIKAEAVDEVLSEAAVQVKDKGNSFIIIWCCHEKNSISANTHLKAREDHRYVKQLK